MFVLFYILCAMVGISFGLLIGKNHLQPKCNHKWNIIESGNIINRDRYGNKVVKGFIKVYECEHCKKLKKEQVELDD
jgi:hypothetical protein